MKLPPRSALLPGILAAALLLSACATNPDRLGLGIIEAQAVEASGRPTARLALPGGGARLLYSRQPAGQQVYNVDLDAQGRVVRREQVLDEAVFARLQPRIHAGQWTRDDVLGTFGQPAETGRVYAFKGDVWTYRYYQDGIDRLWHVHIDPQGIVRQAYSTDEPRGRDDFQFW